MHPPTDIPESKASIVKAARTREQSFKRWLAVLIAFVTLLVGLASFLQADASARSARLNRLAQENAVASTGQRVRGQQQYAYDEFVVAREYDGLRSAAQNFSTNGNTAAASAYITAAEQITRLSPLLGPTYATPRASDGWLFPDYSRYQADTWVYSATLFSQRREIAATEANSWDGKSNNFVAAIAMFAVALFLFGLSSTLSGFVRGMFLVVGIALTAVTLVWIIGTALLPVHHVPDRALEKYAQGFTAAWQGKNDDALQAYSEAIRLDPSYANASSERAYAHLRETPANLTEAIKDYQATLAAGGETYEVDWNLGWTYYLAGDYAKSIPYSLEALEANNKVCGPSFNIAIARLASGDAAATDKAYDAAIARCERILIEVGPSPTVWQSLQGGANDIEDLLCQTHQLYCFAGRDKPSVRAITNREAVRALGEKYRRRVKEALTGLEFRGMSVALGSGAQVEPLQFGSTVYDEKDKLVSYIMRDRFPYDRRNIYALFNYHTMPKDLQTVWKVFRDGKEVTGLRYAEPWALDVNGEARKQINYRFILQAGRYDVEMYGNGSLLATGAFEVDERGRMNVPLPRDLQPSAAVNVGALLLVDNFDNNDQGWWTGWIDHSHDGSIANHEYNIVTTIKDDIFRATCELCYDLDNVYYEAATRWISGPTDYGYGLTVRANRAGNNGYLFLIDADGYYAIFKTVDGTVTKLADWAKHNAVRVKGQNQLGVLARGSTLEFYVNGQLMKRVNDTAHTKGYVGMTVERTDLAVAFSQVRVWQA
ncbi:MAG: tetratricopeptide repeat protein, partial [Chloroflexota bacterium]